LLLMSDSKTTGSKMLSARRTSPLFVLNLQYKSSPLWDTGWRLGGCASCQPTEPRAVSSGRESSDRLPCSVRGPQLVSTASAIQWFSVAKHAHASTAHVSLRCIQLPAVQSCTKTPRLAVRALVQTRDQAAFNITHHQSLHSSRTLPLFDHPSIKSKGPPRPDHSARAAPACSGPLSNCPLPNFQAKVSAAALNLPSLPNPSPASHTYLLLGAFLRRCPSFHIRLLRIVRHLLGSSCFPVTSAFLASLPASSGTTKVDPAAEPRLISSYLLFYDPFLRGHRPHLAAYAPSSTATATFALPEHSYDHRLRA
jgi:hypothetical protein